MSLVVAKFGGTSVADYGAMNRCADIVLANPDCRLVVVSASSGVTNLLVELTQEAITDDARLQRLKQIAQIQYAILDKLGRPNDVAAALDKLLSRMALLSEALVSVRSKATIDELLSLGEQCSSALFSAVLREKGQAPVLLMYVKYCVLIATLAVPNLRLNRLLCYPMSTYCHYYQSK